MTLRFLAGVLEVRGRLCVPRRGTSVPNSFSRPPFAAQKRSTKARRRAWFPSFPNSTRFCWTHSSGPRKEASTLYRDTGQNLRTQAHRIIRRAGLELWPKTFQNLRSTRETELAEEYPVQVICSWIGNSPQVAAKHYLQVREEDFAKAVQNPVQTVHDGRVQPTPAKTRENRKRLLDKSWQKNATPCKSKRLRTIPPRGLEPLSPG